DEPSEQNELALAGLAAKISQELAQFKHGGSLDAERLQGQYVRDYHDYANIAIGLYLAAAGVRIEDSLRIANDYAEVMSEFHEPMDDVYTHLSRRDVRDMKMGYELYQSGRISSDRRRFRYGRRAHRSNSLLADAAGSRLAHSFGLARQFRTEFAVSRFAVC